MTRVNPEYYERAIKSLSEMKVPDFSNENENSVFETFCSVANYDNITTYVSQLREKIHETSKGKITASDGGPDKEVMGISRILILNDGNETLKVTLGPYTPPFHKTRY